MFSTGMDKRRASGVYAIFVGLLMMSMWSMLVLTSKVTYLDTPQMEIKLHIFTEMLTALMLILGGTTVIRGWEKLTKVHYVSQGMLMRARLCSVFY